MNTRKILFLLGALLFFGCGGDAQADLDPSEPVELGQAKQAIVYADGYGVDGAQNRCWYDNGNAGWADGECSMPNGQRWTIVIPDANNTNSCDADFRVGLSQAATDWKNFLNGLGAWNISIVTTTECFASNPPCNTAAKLAMFQCRPTSEAPSSNTLGSTVGPTHFAASLGDTLGGATLLDAGDRGDIISFNSVKGPYIYANLAKSKSFWTGKTSTQKRRFARNVGFHELMHVAGLGHDTFAETPLMGLSEQITVAFDQVLWPTSYETMLLDCVNANRNGLFQNCI